MALGALTGADLEEEVAAGGVFDRLELERDPASLELVAVGVEGRAPCLGPVRCVASQHELERQRA